MGRSDGWIVEARCLVPKRARPPVRWRIYRARLGEPEGARLGSVLFVAGPSRGIATAVPFRLPGTDIRYRLTPEQLLGLPHGFAGRACPASRPRSVSPRPRTRTALTLAPTMICWSVSALLSAASVGTCSLPSGLIVAGGQTNVKAASGRGLLRFWFRADTVRRALTVAAVITPILILINHGDALLSLDITPTLVGKMILTFLVPYAVSSYSSARALLQAPPEHTSKRAGETP